MSDKRLPARQESRRITAESQSSSLGSIITRQASEAIAGHCKRTALRDMPGQHLRPDATQGIPHSHQRSSVFGRLE